MEKHREAKKVDASAFPDPRLKLIIIFFFTVVRARPTAEKTSSFRNALE